MITDHYTAGLTWAVAANDEISAALMYAPKQSVTGSSLFNGVMGPGVGGTETISMHENSFGVSWSHKF